jgi:hypothetical protein
MKELSEMDENQKIMDAATAINAVTQLHNGISYLLEGKCKARVQFDDGVEFDIDLSGPITYIIGIELGAAIGQIMRAENRNGMKMIPAKMLADLQQLLSEKMEERKREVEDQTPVA